MYRTSAYCFSKSGTSFPPSATAAVLQSAAGMPDGRLGDQMLYTSMAIHSPTDRHNQWAADNRRVFCLLSANKYAYMYTENEYGCSVEVCMVTGVEV